MHNANNLAHLDIKPDNIIINDDYTLGFIDFGHTNSKDVELDTVVGTDSYMPPEVRQVKKQPAGKHVYSAEKVDIFTLGITLFMIMFGSVPFGKAELCDSFYKPLGMRNSDLFFKQHPSTSRLAKRGKLDFSMMFMVTALLDPEASKRPCIGKVYEYSWLSDAKQHITPSLQKEIESLLIL